MTVAVRMNEDEMFDAIGGEHTGLQHGEGLKSPGMEALYAKRPNMNLVHAHTAAPGPSHSLHYRPPTL